MNNMKKSAFQAFSSRTGFQRVKGKFSPFSTSAGIESIKEVAIFASNRKNYPFYLFETSNSIFLGIMLARQSSDLLVLIADRVMKEMKLPFSGVKLVQYAFPKENTGAKLLALVSVSEPRKTEPILEGLQKLQAQYIDKLNHLADKVITSKI